MAFFTKYSSYKCVILNSGITNAPSTFVTFMNKVFTPHIGKNTLVYLVLNAAIHHVLILPSLGYFEDESLSFAFALQNEAGSALGNTIVQFPDLMQLTCPTHACGK
ncbi:hypothetical protein DSO57_1017921 [Entomophthora muscae]|uniref:Uncharacterized protein n=1 Tax=Entomophthora muscae TaxID=34485 RepID=A0ACC2S6F1_9FUNG|nr:hypothetical protein DSO57_1017921 [Entomophthora muscae]